MARQVIDADRAFEMLRDHSRHNGHKVIDVAQAIVDSHLLLLAPAAEPSPPLAVAGPVSVVPFLSLRLSHRRGDPPRGA